MKYLNKISEADLQKSILDWLAYQKGQYWRQNTGAMPIEGSNGKKRFIRFGVKGVADILGINDKGQFVAIEVKRKPNKPSTEQQTFIDMVNYWGGIGVVAYELSDVINRFNQK